MLERAVRSQWRRATRVVTMISFGHVILLGHDFDLVVHRVLLVYRVILVHKCYP